MTTLIVIWAVVIAASLLAEFFTYDLITTWFAVGAVAAIILAACGVHWSIQLVVFFLVSLVCLLSFRRIVKRFLQVKTQPTNADANIGRHAKLTEDVTEGRSAITLNEVTWTAICDEPLKKGTAVEITAIQGNKFLVKKVTDSVAPKPEPEQNKSNKGGKK